LCLFSFLCGVNNATSGFYMITAFVHSIAGRNRNCGNNSSANAKSQKR